MTDNNLIPRDLLLQCCVECRLYPAGWSDFLMDAHYCAEPRSQNAMKSALLWKLKGLSTRKDSMASLSLYSSFPTLGREITNLV